MNPTGDGGHNHAPGCRCPFCARADHRDESRLTELPHVGRPDFSDMNPLDFEIDREQMEALLGELDQRLRQRGVAASVFVVGGAAMVLSHGRETMTPDIDVHTTDTAVIEEARQIAEDHNIPETWMNGAVGRFMPARPAEAMVRPTKPGLTVNVASARYVLAMKLVAFRAKDRPDIALLLRECDLDQAEPQAIVDVMRETYSGEDELAHALGISGSDPEQTETEAHLIAQQALDLLR